MISEILALQITIGYWYKYPALILCCFRNSCKICTLSSYVKYTFGLIQMPLEGVNSCLRGLNSCSTGLLCEGEIEERQVLLTEIWVFYYMRQ